MQLLKIIASKNAAVLCTIHQPSSEVFCLFDMVIFMKQGQILYQGPVDTLTTHFAKFGYNCPNNYNPSDFVMSLSQTESMATLRSCGLVTAPSEAAPGDVEEGTKASSEEGGEEAEEAKVVPGGIGRSYSVVVPTGVKPQATIHATFWKQVYLLTHRELLNVKRDVAALIGRFGVTIFLNVLYGLIFLNAGARDDSNPTNFNAHFGALTMVVISSMFGSAQPVMLSFPYERPLFMREYSVGTYSALAYFLSKVVIELPMTLLQTIVQFIISYYMVGMQGRWIYLVLAAWGLGVASSSVAAFLGCCVADAKQVTEFAPLLFVPQLLFAGFFIRTGQIPDVLRWAQYLCGIKYSMNLILLTEFSPRLASCQGGAKEACANVITNNDINANDWWVYVILLVALFVGFRTLGAIVLVRKAQRFY